MKGYYLLAILPFIGLIGGLEFANRIEPFVLGLPFLHFWIVLWVILTSVILTILYKLDGRLPEEENE
ncbi:DUF3311 domain-containing protein [Bacillus sp. 1P06AnD]|uniref:DUF3311 domain-containing protein n=1 Tax=Bacillus sp. 1P06AnD TaxID=3132208 RepID=UPI0039A1CD0F